MTQSADRRLYQQGVPQNCAALHRVHRLSFFLPPVFNVITFIASILRGATQGNMTSQRERTVPEMTHAQPWLSSPTAEPHSHDCYMNTSYSMHNTQSRLPVNDNDVVTSIATIGTFEAVVFHPFITPSLFEVSILV